MSRIRILLMKKALVVLSLAAVAGASLAQSTAITADGLTLRLGGVYPLERATRKITANMIGVGLDFPVRSLVTKADAYVSVDWYGKSASGAKGNMFPVMYNHRLYMNPSEAVGNRSFFNVGVGFVQIDVTKAKTTYGARFGLGKELGQNLSVEGVLLWSSDANGAKANSLAAFLGYRF